MGYEKCDTGVQATKDKIVKSVDKEWLARVNQEVMGFINKKNMESLAHLEIGGANLISLTCRRSS